VGRGGSSSRAAAVGAGVHHRNRAASKAHLQLPHVVLVLPSQKVDLLEQLLLMVLKLPHLARRRLLKTATAAAAAAKRRLRPRRWSCGAELLPGAG